MIAPLDEYFNSVQFLLTDFAWTRTILLYEDYNEVSNNEFGD